jgi:hypothetical protein
LLWVGVVVGSVIVQTKEQFWPNGSTGGGGVRSDPIRESRGDGENRATRTGGRVFRMMTVVARASATVRRWCTE